MFIIETIIYVSLAEMTALAMDWRMEEASEVFAGRILSLVANKKNLLALEGVSKALGSDKRLAILNYLGNHTCSVLEIADALDLPASTATQHINILEEAGLITTDLQPATRGLQRMCARVYDQVVIHLLSERNTDESTVEVSMPIGAYSDVSVTPTCGLAGEIGIIGQLDDPATFYEPERIYAQLLWFHKGFVEYLFPNRLPAGATLDSLELSFEVCSEAPLHHLDWSSDITVWINGTEIGTWTSPADFGGERGALTPAWWDIENTQYGLMKIWKVNPAGSFVDGIQVSDVTLSSLHIGASKGIKVRIGVKDSANNIGGLNLFGKKFGNYPQDIVVKQRFHREPLQR
jgi:predicted transcriptional regulator